MTFNILELDKTFELESNFNCRYLSPTKLHHFIIEYYDKHIDKIGCSELGKPIYKLTLGNGSKNILLWSQMHGNETTGTLSCLDVIKFLAEDSAISKKILEAFTLDFILMLNPDGAEIWTRRNILGIDINRDFLTSSSIEMQLLKKVASSKKYDLAFNLHDQRTIFGVTGKKEPATLAFLSPSESENREITETRKKSMGLIADIYKEISQLIPNKISRFTDEFYPRSVGDNFQKLGIPTILFEGGHYPKDYFRQNTRRYFSLALITALYYATVKNNWEENYEVYETIPKNSTSFYDIIYRNVQLSSINDTKADLGIQYSEEIRKGDTEIIFVAKIEDIGDLSLMHAHKEIDAEGRYLSLPDGKLPKIGILADFKLEEWIISNGKKLEHWV